MRHASVRPFGRLADGRTVSEYTLTNDHGIEIQVLDFGAVIRRLVVPGRDGTRADVVLGFDRLGQYVRNDYYLGAVVGRVAGRIRDGKLAVGSDEYQLSVNDPPNHLHGGRRGFSHVLWSAGPAALAQHLVLTYTSEDGEEGYPGRLTATVSYELTDDNDLIIDYRGSAESPTVFNPTQHSYFSLSGDPAERLSGHTLRINADSVLELDDRALPTGRQIDVTDIRWDLSTHKPIGQLDNFWVAGETTGTRELREIVELRHEASGRLLQVLTTAPGLQIYTGDQLPAGLPGKNGTRYAPRSGICLETQIHPDCTNHAEFPRIALDEGAEFRSTTVFRFRQQ